MEEDRFIIRHGKFGAFFYDKKYEKAVTLEDAARRMNEGEGFAENRQHHLTQRKGKQMTQYRKKPVVIEAREFDGSNFTDCRNFIGKKNYDNTLNYPNIITLEGTMRVNVGDFIIKGINGEFCPCKPDIFEATYEKVEETGNGQSQVTA